MSLVSHPRCPFCHDEVVPSQEKTACHACMAWHHAECWTSHGGCSACGLDEDGEPTPRLVLEPDAKQGDSADDILEVEGQTFETEVGNVEVIDRSRHARIGGAVSYRGRLQTSGEACVVWFMNRPRKETAKKRLARLARELQLHQRCVHPNLLRVLSLGEHKGLLLQVEEWTPGPTLFGLGKQPPQLAARIVHAIASGLVPLHAIGAIHRQLSLEQVALSEDGGCKVRLPGCLPLTLSDMAQLYADGVQFATPLYLAPEIGRVRDVDARADLYSLGLIHYYLLTGKDPLTGFSTLDVLRAKAHREIQDPRLAAPGLREAHRRVVGKLLEFDRDRRYASAEALLADLDALEHPQVSAGAPTLWTPEEQLEPDDSPGFLGRLFRRGRGRKGP